MNPYDDEKDEDPPPPDSDWDKHTLPPEKTPIRRDPMVPRLIAIGSCLIALPTTVFIIAKILIDRAN